MQERCWDNAVDEQQVLRVSHRCCLLKYGERTHILLQAASQAERTAFGITHVCYPKRSSMRFGVALQAVSAKTHLTLVIWGSECVISYVFWIPYCLASTSQLH